VFHPPSLSPRTRLATIAALVLLLAACTSGDDNTPTPTPTPEASPTNEATAPATPEAREPTFAPDGRTAIAEVDAVIEVVLTGDEAALAALYDGLGQRYCSEGTAPSEESNLTHDEWPALLAASDRSLYSVSLGERGMAPPRQYDVVLSVLEDEASEGWRFAIDDGAVVEVYIGCGSPPSAYAPNVPYQYERFLVLPPADQLPQAPLAHPLDRRTDAPEVNAVLDVIESGDTDALLALVEYRTIECTEASDAAVRCRDDESAGDPVEVLPQRACANEQFFRRSDFVEERLPAAIASGTTLHAVAVVPRAYRAVPAEHSIILVNPGANPYAWETRALYVRDGRIVAWDIGCSEHPEQLYPPFAYLVAPGGAYDGNSGVRAIDAALAAFEARDTDALSAAIDWTLVGCLEPGVNLGIGQPPHCKGDEQAGDLIETFSFGSCEGWSTRRTEAIESLESLLFERSWIVYAIADLGLSNLGYGTRYQVVLAAAPSERGDFPAISLSVSDQGLRGIWYGCGPTEPLWLLRTGRTPDFLMPPPTG